MNTNSAGRQTGKKVLAIAIDAAESTLIEKWMEEGYLKNLASLRCRGAFGKLSSTADWLAGSVWPTFYTGTLPGTHGFYHYLQWKSSKMEYDRPGPDWIHVTPFWRRLGNDYKVIAVDIPLTFPPAPFNGIEVSGWDSHDRLYPPSSFPKEKIDWIIDNFGETPIDNEIGGLQSLNDLFNVKEELISACRREAELVINLINIEEWDLCLCCFSSTHRAGHKFWNYTNTKESINDEQKSIFKNWLKEVYQSCDEAIGKILSTVSGDVTVLIFSLHGMGANTSLSDFILPRMISNVLSWGKSSSKKSSLIKKIRNKIPLEWRAGLKTFIPVRLQDKMTAYWRMGGTDWEKTKIFNMLADLQGYIRVNLKGREKEGIVEEGEEYDQLCSRLIEGLKTFKDEKTNEPVIESINKNIDLFNKKAGFNNLPDILVKWKFKPAANSTKIISREYGEIEWPMPGKNPDGRSGNHRPDGFLIVVGKDFKANSTFGKKYHIVDLAPTILNLLDIEKPEEMEGEIISKM